MEFIKSNRIALGMVLLALLVAPAVEAACLAEMAPISRAELVDRIFSGMPLQLMPEAAQEDEYLVGDWDGDGFDNIAVRRHNEILMDVDFDGQHDATYKYGRGNNEDEYLVGDFTQEGCDTIAIRRGNEIWIDLDGDGKHDTIATFGTGAEDEWFVQDFNGDGNDDIGVRTGNMIDRDLGPAWDGVSDGAMTYGGGKNEDQYLWGSWCPPCLDDGIPPPPLRQLVAVRRGNQILMNANHDTTHDYTQTYGSGAGEDEYLSGDFDGDGLDNIAVRRGNMILMDANYDGSHDILQIYGTGTP